MNETRTVPIDHDRFGHYEQVIGDREAVGYTSLAGASGTRHGWNMPDDGATRELVEKAKGRRVLEIGGGDGSAVALRILEDPATQVIALDHERDLLSAIVDAATAAGAGDRVRTMWRDETWWSDSDSIDDLAGEIGEVDLVVARQVLQFGTVATIVNVLRLADQVLVPGGQVWMLNMSPYLGYIHEARESFGGVSAPEGALLAAMVESNRAFEADPRIDVHPNGHCPDGPGELIPLAVEFGFTRLTWIDTSVVRGALALADVGLELEDTFEFSPEKIWERNKLEQGPREWHERELHVAWLRRLPRWEVGPCPGDEDPALVEAIHDVFVDGMGRAERGSSAWVTRRLGDSDALALCRDADGAIVGYGFYACPPATPLGARVLWCNSVAIRKAWQAKRLVKGLDEQVADWLGVEARWIACRTQNPKVVNGYARRGPTWPLDPQLARSAVDDVLAALGDLAEVQGLDPDGVVRGAYSGGRLGDAPDTIEGAPWIERLFTDVALEPEAGDALVIITDLSVEPPARS